MHLKQSHTQPVPEPIAPCDGLERLRAFRAAPSAGRVFLHPTGHPSRPTGFCPCDGAWPRRLLFYAKAWVLLTALRSPFNRLKIAVLRHCGAQIGRNVHIAADVWIDPLFPELLTIEDEVCIGVGVRIALHEFGRDEFRAGRVILRRRALVGGFALLRSGIEVGENANIAPGAVVASDVPAGRLALGNPARLFPLPAPRPEERGHQ